MSDVQTAQILHIALGGTMDADHRKTHSYTDDQGRPVTDVEPYYDDQGRLPSMAYLASRPGLNVESVLLFDGDSKKLREAENTRKIQEAIDLINTAKDQEFERVIITIGTDCAEDIARYIAYAFVPAPPVAVVFAVAMDELTKDLQEDGTFKPDGSDGWKSLDNAAYKPIKKPGVYIASGDFFEEALFSTKDFHNKVFKSIRHFTL